LTAANEMCGASSVVAKPVKCTAVFCCAQERRANSGWSEQKCLPFPATHDLFLAIM